MFHFRRDSMLNKIILKNFRPKQLPLVAMLKQCYFISDVVPC